MNSPNEYDDELFTRSTLDLSDAIGGLWEAGATRENIEAEIESALENATEARFVVTITPR